MKNLTTVARSRIPPGRESPAQPSHTFADVITPGPLSWSGYRPLTSTSTKGIRLESRGPPLWPHDAKGRRYLAQSRVYSIGHDMPTFNRLRDRRGQISRFSFRFKRARTGDGCIQADTCISGRVSEPTRSPTTVLEPEHVLDSDRASGAFGYWYRLKGRSILQGFTR